MPSRDGCRGFERDARGGRRPRGALRPLPPPPLGLAGVAFKLWRASALRGSSDADALPRRGVRRRAARGGGGGGGAAPRRAPPPPNQEAPAQRRRRDVQVHRERPSVAQGGGPATHGGGGARAAAGGGPRPPRPRALPLGHARAAHQSLAAPHQHRCDGGGQAEREPVHSARGGQGGCGHARGGEGGQGPVRGARDSGVHRRRERVVLHFRQGGRAGQGFVERGGGECARRARTEAPEPPLRDGGGPQSGVEKTPGGREPKGGGGRQRRRQGSQGGGDARRRAPHRR
mmetsp:Transcript_14230/g.46721  ORF Transcript_14230/g.46721 Transcript_14230/m.46721 type:complete len:287 (-) Transcript_14230:622-1482(-)